MFLIDDVLLAPGRAVLFLLEELAKKAQEELLDDAPIKQRLQEIYALLESGQMSEREFEVAEFELVERLDQIARVKQGSQDMTEPQLPPAALDASSQLMTTSTDAPRSGPVIDIEPVEVPPPAPPPARPMVDIMAVLRQAFGPDLRAATPLETPPPPEPLPPAAQPPLSPAEILSERPAVPVTSALTISQVIESTMRALALLKLRVSSLTSASHDDGGWRVTAEIVERKSVPDTSDLLAIYELRLDEAGNLLRYERTRMRRRCDLGGR